jgi:aspartyl aminopeptidase
MDYDLCLYDSNKASLSGLEEEFISAGRLDNLGSSIPCLHALINSSKSIENSSSIDCVAIFDNEEVGSKSYQGCDSSFFGDTLRRVFNNIEGDEDLKSNF